MRQIVLLLAAVALAGCGHLPTRAVAVQGHGLRAASLPLKSANGLRNAGGRIADAFMQADDTNHNGSLEPNEFTGFTLPDIKLSRTYSDIDINHDGEVSNIELQQATEGIDVVRGYQQVYYTEFQRFDADHNDQLSKDEFANLLTGAGIGHYLTPTSFFDADANNDGSLNPSEYEDLAFGTYVDFVLVPFIEHGAALDQGGNPNLPVLLPALSSI